MAGKKIRLFKIASEINIGKETIVQYLQQKGFDIQNKPAAILTPEMQEAVFDKFKKEKRAAEKQREKLEKHKQTRRKAIEENKKEEPEPESEKEAPEAKPEAPAVDAREEVESETEQTREPIEAAKPEPEKDIDEDKKDVEKIIEGELTPEPEKEPELPVEETKPIPEPEAKSVEDKDKEAFVEEKKTEVEKPEEKAEEEKSESKTEKETEPKKAEEPKDTDKKEKDTTESDDDSAQAKAKAKKKKRAKVVEVEPDDNEAPKIRGLKVVGKIDLQKEKPTRRPRKGGKKPEDGEGGDSSAKKSPKKKTTQPRKIEIGKAKPEKKRRKKKTARDKITQEEIDRQIKKTLAGMGAPTQSGRSKMKQKRKAEREEKELKKQEEIAREKQTIQMTEFVTTSDLANLMGVEANDVILKCMQLGLMVTINQRLDKDTITLIADDYGFSVEFLDEKAVQHIDEEDDPEESLKPRSPIVTVMGHVDHGKTSLLDYIRHANVVAGEAGGITQHMAAYRVQVDDERSVTFLDTPGHEAFTAMRARGAQVTDIVVLVVAADDSVMPQTEEAISHAKAAEVPIVVAINKIDKADAQPDRIKQQLSDHNILVEDWGGTYQSAELSAKTGVNVDQLLEKLLLESEMLELKANPDRLARGAVIEARMEPGLGAAATIIVQKGTLKVGDPFIAGVYSGKVRAMFDERMNKIDKVGPSKPVRVTGFDGLPEAGDILAVTENEQKAREIASERRQHKREQEFRQVRHLSLDDISQRISKGEVKDLNLIIKADVSGSAEALSDALLKLSTDEVRVAILHRGVGDISENDVNLAVASNAVIIGFQVTPTAQARKVAEQENTEIRLYSIIYDCINDVRLALEGLLAPDVQENVTSTVEVRKTFKISKLGVIAGCYVTEGKITRNDRVRVLRDGLPVYNGTIKSLKRNKDDVKEVDTGFECGIMLDGFNQVEVDDIIESYKIVEIKRTLD